MTATTLTGFLTARLHEDEAVARDAAAQNGTASWSPESGDATDVHYARHDPARVLAEVEAKRRIAELHSDGGESQGYFGDSYSERDHCCTTCGEFGEYGVEWPCRTLRALALPYADHPDYQQEWRP